MAIALGNKDVNYIVADGKVVRQIIRGNNNKKEDISITDCKYVYLGADRTSDIWNPFHKHTYGYILPNIFADNWSITDADSTKPVREIVESGICAYSIRLRGTIPKPDISYILFSMQSLYDSNNSSIQIIGDYDVFGTHKYELDLMIPLVGSVWTCDITDIDKITQLDGNVYATSGYLYINPNIKPTLYIDIILQYAQDGVEKRIQKHISYTYNNDNGSCKYLYPFFAERDKTPHCKIISYDLPNDIWAMYDIFMWRQQNTV